MIRYLSAASAALQALDLFLIGQTQAHVPDVVLLVVGGAAAAMAAGVAVLAGQVVMMRKPQA